MASTGDQLEVVVEDGSIRLVPVVVYPRDKAERLERLAREARAAHARGELKTYDTAQDLFADLDGE